MKKRGRPREFDRQAALEKAMHIFWSLGYEGATLAKLKEAMGDLTAPSFYAAFGSKEELFHEVVKLYQTTKGRGTAQALTEKPTAYESIESMLKDAVELFSSPSTPPGCLIVLGAVNGDTENKDIQDYLKKIRLQTPHAVRKRIERGIKEGNVPADFDAVSAAAYYVTVLHGLSIQARDGTTQETLLGVVDSAMKTWKKFIK